MATAEPGSRIFTDGWPSYPAATRDRHVYTEISVSGYGMQAHEVLPVVHRGFSPVSAG